MRDKTRPYPASERNASSSTIDDDERSWDDKADPERLADATVRTVTRFHRRHNPIILAVMSRMHVNPEDFPAVMNTVLERLHRQFVEDPSDPIEVAGEVADAESEAVSPEAGKRRRPRFESSKGSFATWVGGLTALVSREALNARHRHESRYLSYEDAGLASALGDADAAEEFAVAQVPGADPSASGDFDRADIEAAYENVAREAYRYLRDEAGVSLRDLNLFDEAYLQGKSAKEVARRRGETPQVVYNASHRVKKACQDGVSKIQHISEDLELLRTGGAHAEAFDRSAVQPALVGRVQGFKKVKKVKEESR